jgi:hypothetical protein
MKLEEIAAIKELATLFRDHSADDDRRWNTIEIAIRKTGENIVEMTIRLDRLEQAEAGRIKIANERRKDLRATWVALMALLTALLSAFLSGCEVIFLQVRRLLNYIK